MYLAFSVIKVMNSWITKLQQPIRGKQLQVSMMATWPAVQISDPQVKPVCGSDSTINRRISYPSSGRKNVKHARGHSCLPVAALSSSLMALYPMTFPSYIASRRLASIRKNTGLCDAWFEVCGERIPFHLAIVADISPVFKAALCGDFIEGQSKTIVMPESSRRSVDAILDFAYGELCPALSTDVGLCLDVWRDCHRYQIDLLMERASSSAMRLASSRDRCAILQHTTLYGTVKERERALGLLAEDIVCVSKNSSAFQDLSVKQLVRALSSKFLIATEDEKLDIMLKWKALNPDAPAHQEHDVFALLRLERLESTVKIEKLCMSPDCAGSLVPKLVQVCFNKLNEDVARKKQSWKLVPVPGDVSMFMRRDEWTYFSFHNLAMAACSWLDQGFTLVCENRERRVPDLVPPQNCYRHQVIQQWFSLSVLHESESCTGYVEYKIRFIKEPFYVHVEFPEKYNASLQPNDFDFWLTLSMSELPCDDYELVCRKDNAEIYMSEFEYKSLKEKTIGLEMSKEAVDVKEVSTDENATEDGG